MSKREKSKPLIKKAEKSRSLAPTKVRVSLPKTHKLELILILLISSFVSVYYINLKIEDLSIYIPVSDETEIIRRVIGGIEETGFPYSIYPSSSPNRKLTNEEVQESLKLTKNFFEESYMRYFVYKLSNYFSFNWHSFSNLFYYLVILFLLLVYSLFSKADKLSVIMISFLVLLLGLSSWFGASFHYVRYFSFLMFAQLISFVSCTYIYVYNRRKIKYLYIVLFAFIPVEFHPQGAFNLLFWLGVILITLSYKLYKSNAKNKTLKLFAIFSAAVLVAGIFRFIKPWIFSIALNKISFDTAIPALTKFFELNFPHSVIGIIILILISLSSFFSYKSLSKFEKTILLFATIFFIGTSFFASIIVGGNYTGYNGINRYFTFIHPMYLLILATLLSGIYSLFIVKFKQRFLPLVIYIMISSLFVFNILKISQLNINSYNFSILPRIEKKQILKVKEELKDIDYEIVCSHPGNTFSAFPNKKTHVAGNIKKLSEIIKEDKYLFFFRVNPQKISPDLQQLYSVIPNFSYDGALIHTSELRKIVNN